MTVNTEESLYWKEKGNECVKQEKYEEALLHYSHAIKLDPNNATLYSNRSLAFLKLQQYYHAYTDACDTIRLRRDWAKGYFRKGEVELKTGRIPEAYVSYKTAFFYQPSDQHIADSLTKTLAALEKERRREKIPWLCAGIGIIIGVSSVIGDQLLSEEPFISHPLLMALLTISVASIAYFLGRAWRFIVESRQRLLLAPPFDLLAEMNGNSKEDDVRRDTPVERTHTRFSKAQARAKLKKQKA